MLKELFPDLFPKLAQDGGALLSSSEICWYHLGVYKAPFPLQIPAGREQVPSGLGIRLMTREHRLRYALDR